jgi:hypothetical protein
VECVARGVQLEDCSVPQFEPDKIAGLHGRPGRRARL